MLLFATYVPPPTSLNTTARPSSDRATRVPEEILTDTLVEEIKTRFCFVGDAIGALEEARREFAPAEDDDESDVELPPSSESAAPESEPSERAESEDPPTPVAKLVEDPSEFHLQRLAALYKRYSTATDIQIKVVPPSSHPTGTGRGTLIVPGWIRERAAEVLFEGGDVDECSVAEVVLDALLKVRTLDDGKFFWAETYMWIGTPRSEENIGVFCPCRRRQCYDARFHPQASGRDCPRSRRTCNEATSMEKWEEASSSL